MLNFMKIIEIYVNLVYMARYELISKLDGALWLRIIFKPLLTPKRAFTIQFESYFWMFLIFDSLLGVKRGLKMILSHRAPSSLNMSSYRTI